MKDTSKSPYDQYKEMQIKTASPAKLIVLMYDGAIKFLKLANEAIDKKEIENAHKNIVRAQDIIMELLLSLNMEAGDIAVKLQSLYLYMNKRLMEANIQKKKEPIEEIIKMLTELRDVWNEISKKVDNSLQESLNEKTSSVNITL